MKEDEKEYGGLRKPFQNWSGDWFVFDGLTNRIFTVDGRVVREDSGDAGRAILEYLYSHGMTEQKTMSEIIMEYDFDIYISRLSRCVPSLLLQLTDRCNLNCDYCVYSGNYSHMEAHGTNDMTWETVQQSIDLFARCSEWSKSALVDFYGGEALLRFDLIKKALPYARRVIHDKPLRFRLTTNGILLTRETADWLRENPEMQIAVTVNGPFHDEHRKTASGEGSLAVIMRHIDEIRTYAPDVWQNQISFLANAARSEDVMPLLKFYDDTLHRLPASVSHIRGQNGNDFIHDMIREEDWNGAEETLCRRYCGEEASLLSPYFDHWMKAMHKRQIFGAPKGVFGGCLPGLGKLFVHHDGRFGICETACDKVIIGDLEHGFNREALREIYSAVYSLFNKKCRTCWAQRICTVCLKDVFAPDGSLLESVPDDFCIASRASALNQLRTYCELGRRHPERLGGLTGQA